MAQKTEKEETEFKVAESLNLCVNNCGLAGNPSTENMCQNCFSACGSGVLTSTTNKFPKSEAPRPRSALSDAAFTSRSRFTKSGPQPQPELFSDSDLVPKPVSAPDLTLTAVKEVYRCSGCRRRVGLTGFRCRCGDLFCAKHRFSDGHDCSYDYKSAGREAIARENPVVKAAKIVRV